MRRRQLVAYLLTSLPLGDPLSAKDEYTALADTQISAEREEESSVHVC
jgi:hypothetical protein